MRKNIFLHLLAAMTVVFGLWLFFDDDNGSSHSLVESIKPKSQESKASNATLGSAARDSNIDPEFSPAKNQSKTSSEQAITSKTTSSESEFNQVVSSPEVVIDEYIMAWRNRDKAAVTRLWATISDCEECLKLLVDMIVNKSLEDGMMLELAIKMAALDTNTVLPVFDVMIDPSGNRNTAIILSEKLIKNGRSELVVKIFDVIYKAQQNGYDNFARQLTWVISKLENPAGIEPILDMVVGRVPAAPDYADHVSSVFSKVVHNIPNSESVAEIMASYYQAAGTQEQQRLWEVVSRHEDTLVALATTADLNGQNYEVRKYANAIAGLPNQQAVDGLMKLHISLEYSPDYLAGVLADNVKKNPTIKVLHKLEDYMRNPDVSIESRIFAAEGLLAVRDNRQARYILEKVINNPHYSDPELQAYIGGRL